MCVYTHHFFVAVARSLEIAYKETHGVKGIDLDRFAVPPRTFANVSVNPANSGFCTPVCLPAGLLNASVCRQGQWNPVLCHGEKRVWHPSLALT